MEFEILGPLQVRDGGRDLGVRGHKQRLLLAVLLLQRGAVVSTDRLIDALWGERPPERAAKALQMHVLELRRVLEPGRSRGGAGRLLQTRPAGYALALEPGQLDLERFERAVGEAAEAAAEGRVADAAGGLRAALALWRGPPLADLAGEEALQSEIGRLEELRLAALEDRIDADLALGRHAALIGELERLIAEHPLRERLRAQAMLALYRAGRQAEALELYRDTRRILVDELGIEPGRELRELERRVLAQDPSLDGPDPAVRPSATAPAPAAGGLVGRERELALAMPLIDAALAGAGGALLLVGGEPGIGKSRLAEALASRAHAGGARVAVGRCWEAGGAPAYWPWVQALRVHVRETDPAALRAQVGPAGAELLPILPELRDRLPDLPAAVAAEADSGARFRLFAAVAAFLRAAAAERSLAVFLDDLHAADAPSLLLLRFLAGELAGAPVVIVGCFRDTGEGGPELADALADVLRDPHSHRLSLGGLDPAGTASLLAASMGREPDIALAERVHAQTLGNPLFVAEIGRLLAGDAAAPAQDRLPVPAGVRETIGRRVARRSPACRDVLARASVLGREFDPEVLIRVCDLDEDDLLTALDEAAAAHLVGDVPGARERLRFSHMLVRDVLYDELSAPRRLRLHRRAAEALEELHARHLEPHLAEIAHHFLEAGSGAAPQAADYAQRAGDHAAAQHAHEEAERHYASALALLDDAEPTRVCDLLLALGEVLSRAGRVHESRETLRRAARLADQVGLPDRGARAALAYGGRFAWARASTDPALVPLLEAALAAIGADDRPTRVRLLARLAAAHRDDARRERRVALAQEAVELAEGLGDPVTLSYAREGWWIATEGQSSPGDARALTDELIAIAERIGDYERVYGARDFRLQDAWLRADRPAVDLELEELARVADVLRQPAQRWHLGTSRTMLALMEGRLADAEALIAETLEIFGAAESWNAAVSHRLQLFVLRRQQGRLIEVEPLIARSVPEFPALLRFPCALAHLHAELGDAERARAVFDGLLTRDLEHEHVDAEWLFTIVLLADPCRFLGDRAAAGKLYDMLLPYDELYARAPVEASFGAVARALGVLAATRGDLDAAERHLLAAVEIERRMRARPWAAHALHDLAEVLLTRDGPGDSARARGLLDEAVAGYRALGMDAWAARASGLPGGC
jgi:DNA-binding SARP family transcriptional activator